MRVLYSYTLRIRTLRHLSVETWDRSSSSRDALSGELTAVEAKRTLQVMV
jgi:hypothetical protein